MVVGPIAASQPQAPADSLDQVRRQRAELRDAIHSFEQALAAPVADPGWRAAVSRQLERLQRAVADHVEVTEGPGGLYADLLAVAPRLANEVNVLTREHAAIITTIERLSARGRAEPELVREWAGDLLHELARHRQRGADLVYEAYATDIGGEN
jgi:hemerythrin HHE cation binding domain-containing protein